MKASINSLGNKILPIVILVWTSVFIPNQTAAAGRSSSQIQDQFFLMNIIRSINPQIIKNTMDTVVKIQKRMTFQHEVAINVSPEKIWDFLINIEQNYSAWHPDDHILFQWTKGAPFSAGATFYAEQYMMGEKVKYNGRISECIPGSKITMRFSFPLSLITDSIEMIVEDHGTYSTFKHITHMHFKGLSRTIFKKRNLRMLNDMDAHISAEGENMKNILEKEQ